MIYIFKKYRLWKYKNTILFATSIVLFVFILQDTRVHITLHSLSHFRYFNVFILGFFIASTFTVVPAITALTFLAQTLDPVTVAFTAGLGTMVGDYAIFHFFKDSVLTELKPFFFHFRESRLLHLFSTPYFAWLSPVIGAIIIASPLPDEIGLGLLGSKRIRKWHFLTITFLLNSVGIFLILTATQHF